MSDTPPFRRPPTGAPHGNGPPMTAPRVDRLAPPRDAATVFAGPDHAGHGRRSGVRAIPATAPIP